MIIPINWLNYYVAIYRYMKMTYHNHDMEDYIDYHDIRYILHITITDNDIFHVDYNVCNIPYSAIMRQGEILANLRINHHSPTNPRR